MPFFGKIFGTITGFVTGGPFGALLGAALGHAADRNTLLNPPPGGWAEQWKYRFAPDIMGASAYVAVKIASASGKKDQVMALCILVLSAKLAKCDGPVNRTEIDCFKRLFRIAPKDQKQVGILFDQARHRIDDYPKFAEILAYNFKNEKIKLENAFTLLFMLARSDIGKTDPLHPAEEKFLRNIQHIFNLSDQAWEYAKQGGIPKAVTEEPNAYLILDVTPQTDIETIRHRWRQLVRTYHPDLMAAKGASLREIQEANLKIVKINAAWDYIKRNKGE